MRSRFVLPAVALWLLAVGGISVNPSAFAAGDPDEELPVTLLKPEGSGPFPAVVLLHDCSGLGPRSSGSPARWAHELVTHGYVVLMPDSFSTRGHASGICTVPAAQRAVTPARRAADAYWALAYARRLSFVDARRVVLMGASHGGSSVLSAIGESNRTSTSDTGGFAAAVALYPGCARVGAARRGDIPYSYAPRAPLLILIGEKDDWTPAAPCQELAEAATKDGRPVSIKVYPGAHHAFDSPNPVRYVAQRINYNAPGGRGATTGGDATAWADSIREVRAFFDRHTGTRTLDASGTLTERSQR